MKVLLTVALILGFVVNITAETASDRGDETRASNDVRELELSIVPHKRRYKPSDQIKFDVMLTNSGKEAIYIFGTLNWGYSASLRLYIRDASGKEVQPLFDDLTFESANDQSAFVKLLPNHFLGTNFYAPAQDLNMNRPGRYTIYADYQSPFSATEVQLNPFWGKEKGTIKSNVVWFEVVR